MFDVDRIRIMDYFLIMPKVVAKCVKVEPTLRILVINPLGGLGANIVDGKASDDIHFPVMESSLQGQEERSD